MFKLLRYFSLTSAVAVLVVTAALAAFYRHNAVDYLVEVAERQNVALAQSFANSLGPRLSADVTSASGLGADALRARPETRKLHETLTQLTAGLPVYKVKIYDLDGLTIYSSDPGEIGADRSDNPGFLTAAREGKPASELTFEDTVNSFEGTIEDRNVVESYVPIRRWDGSTKGVFELYSDVTPLISTIKRTTTELAVGLSLAVVLLYAVLFLIVRRADRILKRQYVELVASQDTIKAKNAVLEHEVAERKLAEEALQRLRRQNEQILNSAGEGIYGLDLDGNTTFCNPAAAKMIGWEAHELIGKPQHAILHHTKPDGSPYPREECPIYAAFKDGRTHHVSDEVFWRRDGTCFPVEYTSTPIRDERDELVGAVVVFRDITERRRAEEALTAAKEEAELANRAKSEFLTNMSHELRTPLNAIIGFSDIIKDGSFGPVGDPRYVEYASHINESGRHLLELINGILDLSKVEAGKFELREGEVDVGATIRSCLNLVKGRAEAADLRFVADVADDLPLLHADELRLKQILLNLLSNAVKFTPSGGRITVEASLTPDGELAIRVVDTGVGIPPEDIPKVLGPFSQVDSSLSRKSTGTGLGLSITQALMELHGGRLDLQSEPEAGTTATVTFPARRVIPRQAAEAASAGRSGGPA